MHNVHSIRLLCVVETVCVYYPNVMKLLGDAGAGGGACEVHQELKDCHITVVVSTITYLISTRSEEGKKHSRFWFQHSLI